MTTASEEMVEKVARVLAIQKGQAARNCDCRRCRDATFYQRDNAKAALSAIDSENGRLRELLSDSTLSMTQSMVVVDFDDRSRAKAFFEALMALSSPPAEGEK